MALNKVDFPPLVMNHAATSLIAQASDHESLASLLFILFWAFLVAALIWLVIWLLLGSGDPASATTTASVNTDAKKEDADKAAAKMAADERAAPRVASTDRWPLKYHFVPLAMRPFLQLRYLEGAEVIARRQDSNVF